MFKKKGGGFQNLILFLLFAATGSVLVSHVDRLSGEDLSSMLEKLGTNGKLELHIIGAFADAMAISETLLVPVLSEYHF
jgi:hypothetical protein